MKKLILSLAGAAFVAALAINLTLNKADVLAQNKLLLENIEAMTKSETREEAQKACKPGRSSCAVTLLYNNGSTVEYFQASIYLPQNITFNFRD